MSKTYDRNKVKEKIRKYEVNGRPILAVSGNNAPYYGLIKKSLEESLPHFVGNPRDVIVGYDLLEWAGLQNLTELLYVTNGVVSEMRVLDLGCGSTEQKGYHSDRWLPYMAEMLTRLGARVTGIDYRSNSHATYNHRTINLVNNDKMIEGDFDLIVATSLRDGLVGGTSNSVMEDTILGIIKSILRSEQLMITDLDVAHFGFRPVFFREVNTLWYR